MPEYSLLNKAASSCDVTAIKFTIEKNGKTHLICLYILAKSKAMMSGFKLVLGSRLLLIENVGYLAGFFQGWSST